MKSINYKSVPILSSEVTPESDYLNRRGFLKAIGILTAGVVLTACGVTGSTSSPTSTVLPATSTTSNSGQVPSLSPVPTGTRSLAEPTGVTAVPTPTVDQGNSLTPYDSVIHYNNYYEFSYDKSSVADMSKDFKTSPWEIQVSGLVQNPKTYSLDELQKKFAQKETIYRERCVETWSMVIPWTGFSLAELLKEVQPLGSARYVRFETLYSPDQMPGQKDASLPWPYTEGLRLDEAMHNLTLLATGLYGKPLLPQDGAPVRLVVPWKYGFKSIKSIVKIELTEKQPATFWNTLSPNEYGFYANVNPAVDHPRWSQKTEQRIGETQRRDTLLFNGYAEEVASLYAGMDLTKYY